MEIEKFEALLINNSDFQSIQTYLNRFNPIKIMKMENQEIRHSNILSWLLNPYGNHGLGDEFLKSFLSETFKGIHHLGITSLDIISEDLSDAQIKTEWNKIDILIECPEQKWVFIVENKWRSKQHSNQLERYKKLANDHFNQDGTEILGIYLTLQEDDPKHDKYVNTLHVTHVENLKRIIDSKKTSLSDKVCNFINYYYEIIMVESEQSEDEEKMIKIAQKLFREHREVIDYIVDKGSHSELGMAFSTLMQESKYPKEGDSFTIKNIEYIVQATSNRWISFLPKTWIEELDKYTHDNSNKDDATPWVGCDQWGRSNYPISIWAGIHAKVDTVEVVAEIGPLENTDQRKKLISSIKENVEKGAKFTKKATDEGAMYSRFFSAKKNSIKDVTDSEEIRNVVVSLLSEKFTELVGPVSIALERFVETKSQAEIE